MYLVRLQMLLMRLLKQNHIKLVFILFLNDKVQTNLYLTTLLRNNWWNELIWVTGHCNRALFRETATVLNKLLILIKY